MDDEKEEGPGPLSSVSDEQPHPSTSQDEPQQPTQNTYWLAQYCDNRPATRKRAVSSESSVSSAKRRSLRLHNKEKATTTQGRCAEEVQPDPIPSGTEEDVQHDPIGSGTADVQHDPMQSTSKKSNKPLLTPKERFKGKVFQVIYICNQRRIVS